MEETIESFLDFLSTARGFSPNTIAAYRNDLSQLATFVAEQAAERGSQPKWTAFNRDLMLSYVLAIKEKMYAPATVARKVAAIKTFSEFLVNKGILERDVTKDIGGPKVAKSLPKTVSRAEIEELLKQPMATLEGQRDRAMLQLLYATGMRVSELVSLNVDDIYLDNAAVRCLGKGGKEREIPIDGQAMLALKGYLEQARPHLLGEHEEDALFLNRRGQRLTRQGFWFNLKNYAQRAGIEAEITPHILRHSVATYLLHSGKKNLKELQQFLGHANISTTKIYEKAHLGAR
jgi:integrase/recombinase XerD